jgi:hypothetical protein
VIEREGVMIMSIDTAPRRQVRYNSFDEVLEDAERAVHGKAETTGNWSLGQILEHLAIANDKSIDGFGFQAPFPVRMIAGTFLKRRFLEKGLKPGFQLPKRGVEVLVPDEIDAGSALDHLRRSVQRLKSESKRSPHPFFGRMALDESNCLNLRHAELHMSFVRLS